MNREASIMSNENNYMPIVPREGGPLAIPPAGSQGSVLATAIWRRKGFFLLTILVALAAGAAYLFLVTPRYTGRARLYVRQGYPRVLSESDGVLVDARTYLFTQAELMKSEPVLQIALEEPDVAKSTTLAGALDPVEKLKAVLDAEVGVKNDIIDLTCSAELAGEAAAIANAVARAYVQYHADVGRSSAGEILNILQREKAEKEQELTALLEDMVGFKHANRTLSFQSDRGNIVFQRLTKLADGLTEGQLDLIKARTDYEAVRSVTQDPAALQRLLATGQFEAVWQAVGSSNGEERGLQAQLDELELELVVRRQQSTDHSPAVLVLLDKIETLKAQLRRRQEQFAEACLAAAKERWGACHQQQEQLQAAFDEQRLMAENLNIQAARYAVLESQLQRAERACGMLDERIKELSVSEDAGGLNITLLETAKVPREPSAPKRAQVMGISGALGLIAALGLVLVRDWRDEKLRSTDEVSNMLGTRVLGALPSKRRSARLSGKSKRVVLLEKRSHTAEACRRIRTALLCVKTDGPAKTLLVTSPQRGDGKSTLVSSLAVMMALAGRRTLVVDADLRRPTQHRLFRVPRFSGLTDVLQGKGNAADFARHTSVDGLDILPCGPVVSSPSELLHSCAMAETLAEVSQVYDYVFVDSPCLLPLADAQILAARCDMALLVLRANKTTLKSAQIAIDNLVSVGGRLLGVVVNDVPRTDGYYVESKYESAGRRNDEGSDRSSGGGGAWTAAGPSAGASRKKAPGARVFAGIWKGLTAALRGKAGPSTT